jgi:predicted transcriptional regulator
MPRKRIVLSDKDVALIARKGAHMTVEQIADMLGITNATLRRRIADDVRVMSAYKKASGKKISFAISQLMKLIAEGNPAAIMFFLKCRAGWRETDPKQVPIEETTRDNDRHRRGRKFCTLCR